MLLIIIDDWVFFSKNVVA